ncbi:MAG: anhydro-N-acetylmuramic acid kinase [Alphaproteobacteria bacterium]|nr:anhydro-N-acetylmuramic acid kinase [Alphaproteobacteria bacterium]
MRAIGVMSGTSMDGIDVALIETDGDSLIKCQAFGSGDYEPALRKILLDRLSTPSLASTPPPEALVEAVTDAHVFAVEHMMKQNLISSEEVDLVGFHGQTIFHAPERRITIQIFDGQRAAHRLNIPVASDFRTADVLAGGQGAPLAPLYHRAKLGDVKEPTAILNIGGVSNITYCDADNVIAFDTGPGSALIDDFMRKRVGVAFDRDGLLARSGKSNEERLQNWLAHSYFKKAPPKSLDRNHFHDISSDLNSLSDSDGAASLLDFTVKSIVHARDHLPQTPQRWFICGGGRHNQFLMECLQNNLGVPVKSVEALGWNGDMLEAECFAWLAVRAVKGLVLSLPMTTGVPKPMSGGRIDYP